MPSAMVDAFSKEIEVFDFEVFKIEASFKMSQNRDAKDLKAIVEDSKRHGQDALSNQISKRNG
jgi:predicted FMN-binding regulatory protein PaiB